MRCRVFSSRARVLWDRRTLDTLDRQYLWIFYMLGLIVEVTSPYCGHTLDFLNVFQQFHDSVSCFVWMIDVCWFAWASSTGDRGAWNPS